MIFALTLLLQVMFWVVVQNLATYFPTLLPYVVVYQIAAILTILCGQIILLASWRATSLLANQKLYTDSALPLFTASVVATVVGGTIPLLTCLSLLFVFDVGGPTVVLGIPVSIVLAVTGVLIVFTLKKIFLAARNAEEDLAGVI